MFIFLTETSGGSMGERSHCVLVVEDDPRILEPVKYMLEREDVALIPAENGREGLERALEEHPDLIILDINMPVMDGFSLLEKLREDEWGKNASVIIYTNYDDGEMRRRAEQYGAKDFLVKLHTPLSDLIKHTRAHLHQ